MVSSKTTTLIGSRCKDSNVFSLGVLMTANHPNTDLHLAKCEDPLDERTTKNNRLGFFDVGVLLARDPPLPIPNREVQPRKPDDTCGLGCWESRVCRHQSIVCGFFKFSSGHHHRTMPI